MAKKICVIGAGAWGENHVRTLNEMGCLGGVMDKNAERLEYIRDKYNTEVFCELDEAIQRRFDGYVVSSSAETHYSIAKAILSESLPCIIEKPMTIEPSESEELVVLAKEKNVTLMVAHILLFHPAINKIKELIDSGAVGKLFYLYSTRIKFGVVRTEENVFESFAPHDLAVLDYLVGSPAEKIEIHTGNFLQEKICDYALASMEYADNVKAHIQVSWLHPFKEQRVVVVGSKGMIWFDDAGDKKVYFCNKHVEWEEGFPALKGDESVAVDYDDSQRPLERELRYFVEHLDKKPEYSTGEAGCAVLRVLEQARERK